MSNANIPLAAILVHSKCASRDMVSDVQRAEHIRMPSVLGAAPDPLLLLLHQCSAANCAAKHFEMPLNHSAQHSAHANNAQELIMRVTAHKVVLRCAWGPVDIEGRKRERIAVAVCQVTSWHPAAACWSADSGKVRAKPACLHTKAVLSFSVP